MLNNFYLKLPSSLLSAAVSLYSYSNSHKKYGGLYNFYFNYLRMSSSTQQAKQAEIEKAYFLENLSKCIPFFESYGSLPIQNWPIIDKNWVINNYKNLQFPKAFAFKKTSGSSGQPLYVPYNKASYQKEYAYWWHHRNIGNIKRNDKIATIAGHKIFPYNKQTPPYWIMNYAENQLVFSSYHLSIKNFPYYIRELNLFKPKLIHGYPSSIFLLARYIIDHSITLQFSPTMIITASETTLDYQRSVIEKAFNAKVFIWYGNTEFCGHITECAKGRLHAQPYHSFIRILDQTGRDVAPGEEGFIVASNFTNTCFPLVNYNTYDIAHVSLNQACDCGMGGILFDSIQGRVEDYIVTPDKRFIGRLDHLFKNAQGVRNAQIEQTQLNKIILRIEKDPNYKAVFEKNILDEARDRLGEKMVIKFEYVDEIKPEANRKYKFIVQRLVLTEILSLLAEK